MPKCFFCGNSTPQARGKMFVKNDGKILYFCNSKCHKNWKLRRVGKNVKWTHTFRKEIAGKKAAGEKQAVKKEVKEA